MKRSERQARPCSGGPLGRPPLCGQRPRSLHLQQRNKGFPKYCCSGAEVMRLRSAVAEQSRQAEGASEHGIGFALGIFGNCPGLGCRWSGIHVSRIIFTIRIIILL